MTAPLREALRLTAEQAPAYPVHDRAVATAGRRRRRAAGLASVALIAALTLIIPLSRTPGATPPAGTAAALPDRIGLPPYGAKRDTDRPAMTAATVLFTGSGSRFGGWVDDPSRYALVGGGDEYRTMTTGFFPGAGGTALLSPDGRSVAYTGSGPTVEVVNLADLGLRHLPGGEGSSTADPVAWSPDGQRLVVRGSTAGPGEVLSLVDVAGGTSTRLAEAPESVSFPAVAFAADGRLAYQQGRQVHVLGADGRETSSFPLPVGAVLAGRGAWTPDGKALTVVPFSGSSWGARYVDPASGARHAGPALPSLSNLSVREVLGWWPDGSALVSVHDAESARILALAPGPGGVTTVLTAPVEVTGMDVAAGVLRAGLTREAHPPGAWGPRFWQAFTQVGAVVVGVALVAWWLRRRAARRRSLRVPWPEPGPEPHD